MIVTELYSGQGLGNQLWCYVTLRAIARNKGYDFGIQSPELFKGIDFMNIDFGKPVIGGKGPQGGPPEELPMGITYYHREKALYHRDGSDIRMRDELLINIPDNTKIDGCLQDVSYLEPLRDEIREWLTLEPALDTREFSKDDLCIINFRGGSYTRDHKFFLPESYWKNAVREMKKIHPSCKFIVITDDTVTAKKFFPDYDVFHFSISKDYAILKNAKYLILSNSSFAFFPAWLSKDLKYCIAPKYWARHNVSDGYWSLGYNMVKGWNYLDKNGILHTYESCKKELDLYVEKNKDSFISESTYTASLPYVAPKHIATKRSKDIKSHLYRLKQKILPFIKKIVRTPVIETPYFIYKEYKEKKTWQSPENIKSYRSGIKIYDAFTFFNELDLLEIRLNILDPYVDYFVIVEATENFNGDKKPLYFQLNKERFKKWEHKIIHHVVSDVPQDEQELRMRLYTNKTMSFIDRQTIQFTLTSGMAGLSKKQWIREFFLKESLRKALAGLRDDDICYISDLDEIWNPQLLIDYTKDAIFKPLQTTYVYFLNNRSKENWRGWTGTIVTKYKNIKHASVNILRTHRIMTDRYTFLRNGGWHFTFQGGYEGALRKIRESNHFFYKPETTLKTLKDMVLQNKDYQGRNFKFTVDNRGLPEYLLKNKEKYKTLFK